MAILPHTGPGGFDCTRELNWSHEEKVVARRAFELALQHELRLVIAEAKKRAQRIQQPSDLWDLERYLTRRRTEIDREFDYRYSVLISVFGELIRQGRLTEQDLQGLSKDKLDAIRRYADLNLRLA